jgi:hypothetical protein
VKVSHGMSRQGHDIVWHGDVHFSLLWKLALCESVL